MRLPPAACPTCGRQVNPAVRVAPAEVREADPWYDLHWACPSRTCAGSRGF